MDKASDFYECGYPKIAGSSPATINKNNNNVLHLYWIAPFPLDDQRRYELRQKQENSVTKGKFERDVFVIYNGTVSEKKK